MTGEVFERLPNDTHEVKLPSATIDDLFSIEFNPNDDPNHRLRWLEFQDEQPVVAQELLDSLAFLVEDTEARRQVINQITLVYGAIKKAIGRDDQGAGTDLDPAA